jgi:hypothetical protein
VSMCVLVPLRRCRVPPPMHDNQLRPSFLRVMCVCVCVCACVCLVRRCGAPQRADRFPVFRTIHQISFEGKHPSAIVRDI